MNPIDWILVQSSKIFPLDYIVFLCLVFYVFICVLYGIIRLGIKILCFTVFYLRFPPFDSIHKGLRDQERSLNALGFAYTVFHFPVDFNGGHS